jgi:hypothetical protein
MSNTPPDASDQRSLREAVDAYSDEIGEEQDPNAYVVMIGISTKTPTIATISSARDNMVHHLIDFPGFT